MYKNRAKIKPKTRSKAFRSGFTFLSKAKAFRSGYREHTNPLFYRAKCLKLKDIYSLETAKLMYKIHNNVLSFANTDKFNLIKNCYTHKTRLSHKNNFFLPRTRTRLGQKSLSFAGIKVWNEIPSSMKEVSFYRFKKAVKAHFLSNYETDKS